MRVVGLTGGIGSGKSAVAARLRELGARVIDADRIAREVVEPGQPALAELAERFGPDVLHPDGSLDRAAMAAVAFASDEARTALEAITHPRIDACIAERVAEAARDPGVALVVVDHPLLVETGAGDRYDALVVVLDSEERRLTRLVAERGMDPADVRARMRAQAGDDARLAAATHVVHNDGDLDALRDAVDRLHEDLLDAPA